jgi:hypothetical protein
MGMATQREAHAWLVQDNREMISSLHSIMFLSGFSAQQNILEAPLIEHLNNTWVAINTSQLLPEPSSSPPPPATNTTKNTLHHQLKLKVPNMSFNPYIDQRFNASMLRLNPWVWSTGYWFELTEHGR